MVKQLAAMVCDEVRFNFDMILFLDEKFFFAVQHVYFSILNLLCKQNVRNSHKNYFSEKNIFLKKHLTKP